MRSVFLCHASEDKSEVEPVQLALASAGCEVFYDERSLPPGGDYYARIRSAIAKCDLFVFVASPMSVAPGKFTLTELGFVSDRWPSPAGRVLPVAIKGMKVQDLPAYLRAATVLTIRGNAAAEVRAATESMLGELRRKRMQIATGVLAALGAAIALAVLLSATAPEPAQPSKPSATNGPSAELPPAPKAELTVDAAPAPAPTPWTLTDSLEDTYSPYLLRVERPEKAPNGMYCRNGNWCESGNCKGEIRELSAPGFCLSTEMECGWPGEKRGFNVGKVMTYGANSFKCVQDADGRRLWMLQ